METEPEAGPHGTGLRGADDALGFVVVGSSEGDHLGARLPIPEGKGRLLGRGGARAEDELVRVSALRQRPGHSDPLGPFEHRSLSRAQLLMSRVGDGVLAVKNVGQCVLLVNGNAATEATVKAGDVLELGSQLVLLCCVRPARLPGDELTGHSFGDADEHGIVGESPAVWALRASIRAVAPLEGHTLILGATGTGKELVARALHSLSKRAGKLTSRNAATLPESLVDAELFGNLRNYPNPGTPEREGLVGAAHDGSLFLDEFADLPIAAQAHLLRALDDGEYQRLGETSVRHSRFRLLAATNRPEGDLRRDLLERFPFRIALPPLSERREDIPLIARRLFGEMAKEAPARCARYLGAAGSPKLSPTFVRRLMEHPFTGNVRELRSLIWASLHEATTEWLEWPRTVAASLPPDAPAQLPAGAAVPARPSAAPVRDQVRDLERKRIVDALAECQGNQTRAAELLGMPRRTLVAKMAQYALPRPRKS
jgi:two-component system nitrogen regulation response regulator GlnG/two-component system response regulator HydG